MKRYAKSTAAAIRRKIKTTSKGEEEKFVNVTGGRQRGPEVETAVAWLNEIGLGGLADVVKGPLIRKSDGYTLTHDPLIEHGPLTVTCSALPCVNKADASTPTDASLSAFVSRHAWSRGFNHNVNVKIGPPKYSERFD